MALQGTLKWGSVFVYRETMDNDADNIINQVGAMIFALKDSITEGSADVVLLDEEALFLVESGILEIHDGISECAINSPELWALFCSKASNFPVKYKVYEYFKQKG